MANPPDTTTADPLPLETAQQPASATSASSTRTDSLVESRTPESVAQIVPESKPAIALATPNTAAVTANGSTTDCSPESEQQRNSAKFTESPAATPESRRSSTTSTLRFETPQHSGYPQGRSRGITGSRIRNASPPHSKFHPHVAFDTINPDIPKNPGITLSARHNGFHAERRSKTFMVGVDENKYSEEALEWLLTSMVDDHDTVVCVRVIEKDVKHSQSAAYKSMHNSYCSR
ncbi:unnamed protein product [Parascedosporium putredinis]|uniref:UspA domain-containing protein n=1 Tax=Parascedosporium putredinis TaxID=1442378 RepID=A0A9P1MDP7_9PEZI|nr:unnamed protein product [Parascedosporium putredinis]CAI8003044.1 unnamed protein product [Parascedosporium putredinis]